MSNAHAAQPAPHDKSEPKDEPAVVARTDNATGGNVGSTATGRSTAASADQSSSNLRGEPTGNSKGATQTTTTTSTCRSKNSGGRSSGGGGDAVGSSATGAGTHGSTVVVESTMALTGSTASKGGGGKVAGNGRAPSARKRRRPSRPKSQRRVRPTWPRVRPPTRAMRPAALWATQGVGRSGVECRRFDCGGHVGLGKTVGQAGEGDGRVGQRQEVASERTWRLGGFGRQRARCGELDCLQGGGGHGCRGVPDGFLEGQADRRVQDAVGCLRRQHGGRGLHRCHEGGRGLH
eukprot:TRINITY_DN4941_c0_g1_i1.p2 TRINITY_DN4941_c0_g1~~TRINITY_DN4941_c0_g1_i1.p2  ORF type:complete len:291 (+),score=46.85 TRINITY_DN4941_c0_g1_i1:1328-2200(+)